MGVDFSHHTAISGVLAYAKKIGAAAVIGTTGHTEEEKTLIYAAAQEIPVLNVVDDAPHSPHSLQVFNIPLNKSVLPAEELAPHCHMSGNSSMCSRPQAV